jgi:hypothetical protein
MKKRGLETCAERHFVDSEQFRLDMDGCQGERLGLLIHAEGLPLELTIRQVRCMTVGYESES